MNLLVLDTSSDACSAALWTPFGMVSEFELTPRAHTQLILPMIASVLARGEMTLAQVDAIAFGCGPGAFTGIRIAAGVAQGLALAADKRLIPISTLAALAQQTYQTLGAPRVLVALDARMNEVYWGEYAVVDGRMQSLSAECVVMPGSAPMPLMGDHDWAAVGNGWQVYESHLMPRFQAIIGSVNANYLPSAEWIAPLAVYAYEQGQLVSPESIEPVYLRNKVALTTVERTALKQ